MDYSRHILALDDKGLERLVLGWAKVMTAPKYHDSQRFAGAGDMGRDVVGFLTAQRHEGPWHNYQCKQLSTRNLQVGTALLDLAKVIHFSHCGEFALPTQFTFVAPRGLSRSLERLIFNPSLLKQTLIDSWDAHYAHKIEAGKTIALNAGLLAHLASFDFTCVDRRSLDDILADMAVRPILAQMFGADPGKPPDGTVPPAVDLVELRYAGELVAVYGERDNCVYGCHEDITGHPVHGQHFYEQRERFYAADAFSRFYRDNTLTQEMTDLREQMYHGVIEMHRATHQDSLARVNAVMGKAADVVPAGPLALHARVQVKQGIWHHFVNEERLSWKL